MWIADYYPWENASARNKVRKLIKTLAVMYLCIQLRKETIQAWDFSPLNKINSGLKTELAETD
jgi:hypothetical protein